jgi:hypothetical protein
VLFGTGAVIGAMVDGVPVFDRLRSVLSRVRDSERSWEPVEPAESSREDARVASEVTR